MAPTPPTLGVTPADTQPFSRTQPAPTQPFARPPLTAVDTQEWQPRESLEDIDEDDLMDELDALEFEMQEEDLTKEAEVPAYMQEPDLPTAPTSAVPAYEEPAIPAQQELDNYGLPAV